MRTTLFAALILVAPAFAEAPEKPEVGKPAPAIELEATQPDKLGQPDAKKATLKGVKGKNVVLFFYPKALTKGCTIESCGFTKLEKELAEVDTVAIGISTDTVEKQKEFTDKEKLTTPLFADPDKKATKAYGALNDKNGLAFRYTFIIDKKGIVRKIYTMVTPAKHPEEVLAFIKENLK